MGDRYCTRRRTATSQPTEEPITNAADKQGKLKSQSVTTERTSDKQSKRRKRSSLEVEKTIIRRQHTRCWERFSYGRRRFNA
jgi:hypothetical protein